MLDRMTRGRRSGVVFAFALLALVAGTTRADDVIDATGFNRNREFFSQLPYEHIDPLTGNLLLTFTDLALPGNAGFDLRIQRTYNGKIYRNYDKLNETLGEDSWAGVGWTLHMGRVFHANDGAAPIVEMPDGSRHQTYHHVDSSGRYISRDYWVFNKSDQTLKIPNGVVYTFGHLANISGTPSPAVAYATRIVDPFGNRIDIEYFNQSGASGCQNANAPADGICRITQYVGSQTREVTFSFEPTRKTVSTMTYATHTWTYTSIGTDSVGYGLLTQVDPPEGTPWMYEYKANIPYRYELTKLTTPQGGTITYTYDKKEFYLGSNDGIWSVVVASRVTGGRAVTAGTWTYQYAQGTNKNQTVITSAACGTTQTSTFLGVGDASTVGAAWKVGLLASRTLQQSSTVLETESVSYRTPAYIDRVSYDLESVGGNTADAIYVPLVESRTITRSGQSYTVTKTYNSTSYDPAGSSFNDYGRPWKVDEQGELSRSTTFTFWYGGAAKNIFDRISSETVTVSGESFTKSWTYRAADGFKTADTMYGITTTFSPDSYGNVQSATDANAHITSFTHDWGVVKNTVTPEYTIQRQINPEGTVASETRRGFTNSFSYDPSMRPTGKTPPVGNPTTISYDNDTGSWVRKQRGTSSVTSYLDGFGRAKGTANAVGVKTNVGYDACGRKCLESLAYDATYPERDVTYAYDGLNRLTRKTNPDTSTVQYGYSAGIDVTITDEESKKTFQNWSGFGDPRDAWLMGVAEAYGTTSQQTTTYAYNALGSLKAVTHPTGGGMSSTLTRTWAYYGPSESGGTPGLLKSETHPESGTVTYTYYPAGNLKTRTDPQFGTTTYTYDDNNRLTGANRPGTAYDSTISWDASDNRTGISNGYVASTFGFDGGNRMTSRRDVVGGKTFDTVYVPDANDNIWKITYPSGRQVVYGYDAENRIASVTNGLTSAVFAKTFTYHPSGQPLSFTAGNNIVHQFTYDANTHRLSSLTEGAAVLKLGYVYDKVGNVKTIADSTTGRTGMNQAYTYDDFDRLKTAAGYWPGGSTPLTYDSVGNMRTTSVGGATGFGYDNTHNRIASASGAYGDAFGYDANGNLISNAVGTYTFTPENMIETATVGATTTTYRYDGDNSRSLKIAAGGNHYYMHGPGGQLLGEYTDSGCGTGSISLRDYVFAGTRLLAEITALPQLALTAATASVVEDGGSIAASVRLTTPDGCPLATDVTVAYATANGTALAGSDYTTTSGTLTIAKGTANGAVQAVTIPIVNDTIIEPTETFTFTLSNPAGGVLVTPSVETITILDNDTPTITLLPFASGPTTSGENVGKATVSIQITTDEGNNLTAQATVKYATAAGAAPAATAGVDFTAIPATVWTFPIGTPSGTIKTIDIPIKQDALIEANENLTFVLSAPTGAVLGTASTTVQIFDDEPTVTLTSASTTLIEDAGSVPITVKIFTKPGFPTTTPGQVTVKYATANGTAVAPGDYTATTGILTFPAGTANEATQAITVPVIDDSLSEKDETFSLTLSAPAGAALGTVKTHTVTIRDNDTPIITLLPFTSSPATSGEGVGKVTMQVQIATVAGSPVTTQSTVKYATAAGVAPAATAGADFTTTAGTLTFAAGTASGTIKTVDIPILQDVLVESNENLTFSLSAPVNALLGANKSVAIQIFDDEPTVTLTAASSSLVENNGPASAVVKILTKAGFPTTTPGQVTVKYATANGTAVAPGDYTATTGILTFPAGTANEATQAITVPVIDDSLSEKDETFTLTLSAPVGAALGTVKTHTVTIQDNDTPTITLLPFTSGPTTSGEGVGKATVQVQITTIAGAPLTAQATVKYVTAAGVAPAATAGVDFTTTAGTLTFAAGTASGTIKTVDIPILQDSLAESDENVAFTLTTPVGAALGATKSVNIQIIDDEPTVTLTAATSLVMENAGPASVSVQLLTKPGFPTTTPGPVTVKYATANGTALAGSDYTATTGTLTFPAGTANEATQTVSIPIINDAVKENEETFALSLSAPVGARLGAVKTHTVTIRDDDAPTISLLPFTSSPTTSGENVGKATVTVQMTTGNGQPLAAPVSVKYSTAAGVAPAATANVDFTAIAATVLTFEKDAPTGTTKTFDVIIKQDALVEADENFTVRLSAPVGAVLGTWSVNVQIIDDEPTVEFVAATSSVAESAGSVSAGVKLLTKPGFPTTTAGPVTVRYATANGTALAGSDYTATAGVLTFAAGTANETTQNVTVPIVKDTVTEPAETFKVNLSAPTGAALGTVKSHTVTIEASGPARAIKSVPYVIDAPGTYTASGDLASDLSQDAAILIAADDVELDLSGFSLTNVAGTASEAVGISAQGRKNVTVKNGTVRGFATAVKLGEGEKLVVEDVLAVESRVSGVEVDGTESVVRRCRVVDTAGSDGSARGLVVSGASIQVLDNDVLDTVGVESHGMMVRAAPGALVSGNRVGTSRGPLGVGMSVVDSESVRVTLNRITGTIRGIVLERSEASCSGNVTSGVEEAGECVEVER